MTPTATYGPCASVPAFPVAIVAHPIVLVTQIDCSIVDQCHRCLLNIVKLTTVYTSIVELVCFAKLAHVVLGRPATIAHLIARVAFVLYKSWTHNRVDQ
jgi:hypothetical protein